MSLHQTFKTLAQSTSCRALTREVSGRNLRQDIGQAPGFDPAATLIRFPDVVAMTGLARATIYKRLKDDPTFPRPCLLYTSPSPRDATLSRMPSSA